MDLPNYTDLLNKIIDLLSVSDVLTPIKAFQIIIPIFSSVLAAFLGAFFGYYISRSHEKRNFKRDTHFNILKALNHYLFIINDLQTSVVGIIKLKNIMLDNITDEFYINPDDEYYNIGITCKKLQEYIKSGTGVTNFKNNKTIGYRSDLLEKIEKINDFNVFIHAGTELEKNAVNFLLLVDKNIRKEYEEIRDKIAIATQNNMKGFILNNHKQDLINFIFRINDKIEKYS